MIPQSAGVTRWQHVPERELLDDIATEQRAVAHAVVKLQRSICRQVAHGIVDAIGLNAWPSPDHDGVWVELPAGSDIAHVAQSIELEGAAARPADGVPYLLLLVQPWFDAEEIDQTILCCLKVVHVLLGVHAPDTDLERHLQQDNACHWRANTEV
jgi:hypothetical protein